MSFPNQNKYKLVKQNKILTNSYKYTNQQPQQTFNTLNSYSQASCSYNQINKSKVLAVNNTAKLLDLNQKLESSNKLDDLLKRCRAIGANNSKKSTFNPLLVEIPTLILIFYQKKKVSTNVETNKTVNISRNQFKVIKVTKLSIIRKIYTPLKTNILSNYSLDNRNKIRKSLYQINHFKTIKQPIQYKINNFNQSNKYSIKRAIINVVSSSQLSSLKKENQYKVNNKNAQQYCLFYNRFGRCSRGSQCKLVHDPKRVTLCSRFLRGTCKLENCPFFHVISAEKMPLCSFYASGCCIKVNCPYSHVYNGEKAEFCIEFAKGFCALGSKCCKSHLTECPDFMKSKICPRGSKCPLTHRSKLMSKKRNKAKPKVKSFQITTDFGASFIPIDTDKKIAETVVINESEIVLKTRPIFGKK